MEQYEQPAIEPGEPIEHSDSDTSSEQQPAQPARKRKIKPEWHVWVFDVGYWRYTPRDRVFRSIETAVRAAKREARGMQRSAVIVLPGPADRKRPTASEIVTGAELVWGKHPDNAYGGCYGITSWNPDLEGLMGWKRTLSCSGLLESEQPEFFNNPPTWW